MCGIFGILKKESKLQVPLTEATQIIRHRGPDDSGFMTWSLEGEVQYFADEDTSDLSIKDYDLNFYNNEDFDVAFGHRRLSILDLSSAGHQPMSFENLIICFNGEIYNYVEIRKELEKRGKKFITQTDTEVILQAWSEWGQDALHMFNGMFSFLILDTCLNKVFAVRDRFGVKPLYFTDMPGYLAFSSEIKQLRLLPQYKFELNNQITYEYLRYGYLDHSHKTFEIGIYQVEPGEIFTIDVISKSFSKAFWYNLSPSKFIGNLKNAKLKFRSILKDAVKLRLRSDVPIGSALSGGLDSSTIVCLMREILDEDGEKNTFLQTVTSCSQDIKFDETRFAEMVNEQTNSFSHKTFPDFTTLKQDLGKIIWHMDYPFGSSSQFAQWSVFMKAKNAGLTVMIDGQGADEQLAGYGGNDLPLYTGLLKNLKLNVLIDEIISYRKKNGSYPLGFLLGALQATLFAKFIKFFPKRLRPHLQHKQEWLNHTNVREYEWKVNSLYENLYNQVQLSPLPALLRYEDRNSMAFSVESRTPFMDYRLMEFSLGLPEKMVYKRGNRKFILREAFRGIVPSQILDRKDKMGFVSEEERWIKEEGKAWFLEQVLQPLPFPYNDFFISEGLEDLIKGIQSGEIPFTFEPWRILNFKIWIMKMIEK